MLGQCVDDQLETRWADCPVVAIRDRFGSGGRSERHATTTESVLGMHVRHRHTRKVGAGVDSTHGGPGSSRPGRAGSGRPAGAACQASRTDPRRQRRMRRRPARPRNNRRGHRPRCSRQRTSTRLSTMIRPNTDAGPPVMSGWSWRLPLSCRRGLRLGSRPVESGVPLGIGCVRGGHIGPTATETWKFPAPTDRSRVAMTAAGLS